MSQPREQWTSRIGFVLAAAGSAIGLGNLWKFPYITWENDGGAFVLVYLACVIAVGLPIMIAEILVGRKTQRSAVGAMREAVGPAWSVVGGWGVFTGFVILGYYSVVAGWTLSYFVRCLAWSTTGYDGGVDFGAFVGDGGQQVLLAALFMIATMGIVFAGIGRGIERVARVLMPALFAILIVLLVQALRLRGAGEALGFIFAPDFAELSWGGVLEALGHAFFTLSLGMGAMITYGSYLGRRESVASASMMVVVLDTVIAMLATIIMFSVIFTVPGTSEAVEKSTAGMLFVTLPELFYTAVPLGKVLAPLFFVLVSFAALTSTISLLEVVAAYFIDERKMSRARATLTCGGMAFAVSVLCAISFGAWDPISSFAIFSNADGPKPGMFNTLDHLASNWLLPIGGLLITIAVGWVMGRRSTEAELVEASTPRWFHYGVWLFFIRFVAPLAVAAIIVTVIFFGRDFS